MSTYTCTHYVIRCVDESNPIVLSLHNSGCHLCGCILCGHCFPVIIMNLLKMEVGGQEIAVVWPHTLECPPQMSRDLPK